MHHGAFSRFSYDIARRLKFGKKNLLEVTVSKESASAGVNLAERRAYYWNFGGIFRPVFLEVNPPIHIAQLSIDAKVDGTFKANCQLNKAIGGASLKTILFYSKGNNVAETTTPVKASGDWAAIELSAKNPKLWTAETPNRYTTQVSLIANDGVVFHQISEKFGFPTLSFR